uniref:Uncharacterized protein n=1 Tax=Anguilla anguilla TaxID=7936 RepID=A0A0E9QNA0_ANGAN
MFTSQIRRGSHTVFTWQAAYSETSPCRFVHVPRLKSQKKYLI